MTLPSRPKCCQCWRVPSHFRRQFSIISCALKRSFKQQSPRSFKVVARQLLLEANIRRFSKLAARNLFLQCKCNKRHKKCHQQWRTKGLHLHDITKELKKCDPKTAQKTKKYKKTPILQIRWRPLLILTYTGFHSAHCHKPITQAILEAAEGMLRHLGRLSGTKTKPWGDEDGPRL